MGLEDGVAEGALTKRVIAGASIHVWGSMGVCTSRRERLREDSRLELLDCIQSIRPQILHVRCCRIRSSCPGCRWGKQSFQ